MCIAKTIVNRYAYTDGATVSDIIYAPGQYNVTEWAGFPEAYSDRNTDAVELACYLAVAQDDLPKNLWFFRADHYHSFAPAWKNDGKMFFSLKEF